MAKVTRNAVTEHLRGKIGDVVFRRVGDQLVASFRPRARTTPPTPNQSKHQSRFKQAADYAKAATRDPALAPLYQAAAAGTLTAYGVAISDFFTTPVVETIDLSEYRGAAGGRILLTVTDAIAVKSVAVTLRRTADQSVLETGPAEPVGDKWQYTARLSLAADTAIMVEVTAVDHARNQTVGTAAYP